MSKLCKKCQGSLRGLHHTRVYCLNCSPKSRSFMLTEEYRANRSKQSKGIKRTEREKAILSSVNKGKRRSPETEFKKTTPFSRGSYKILFRPGHPTSNKNGYIPEHRLIMEQYLQRKLEPGEEVHHLNGDKSDNRIENLKVVTRSDHAKFHAIWKHHN